MKHVVATWNLGNHLSLCFQAQENQKKPVSKWPVAGPSEYGFLPSSPAVEVFALYDLMPCRLVIRYDVSGGGSSTPRRMDCMALEITKLY